jgi:hypothetical protein
MSSRANAEPSRDQKGPASSSRRDHRGLWFECSGAFLFSRRDARDIPGAAGSRRRERVDPVCLSASRTCWEVSPPPSRSPEDVFRLRVLTSL